MTKCVECGCEEVKEENVNFGDGTFEIVLRCEGCGFEWGEE